MNLDQEILKEKLEGMEIDSDKIEELLLDLAPTPTGDNGFFYKMFKAQELKKELLSETDWRKKAAIRAKLISLDLE